LLDELLESEHLRSTDSFVLGILTHGDYHEGVATIEFHDSSYTNLDTVITKFQNHNCQQLINKPKIFLFPFCRGNVSDHGVYIQRYAKLERDHIGAEVTMSVNMPTFSDILICYATVPGFQTHRDPMYGSWYIQSMCKIWSARAHDTDVEDLVKMVGYGENKFMSSIQRKWEMLDFMEL
jgi:caspase Dronc